MAPIASANANGHVDIFAQEDELGKIGEYNDRHYHYHSIVTRRNGYKRNMDAVPGVLGKSTYLNLRVKFQDQTNSTGYTHSRLSVLSGIERMIPADSTQVPLSEGLVPLSDCLISVVSVENRQRVQTYVQNASKAVTRIHVHPVHPAP